MTKDQLNLERQIRDYMDRSNLSSEQIAEVLDIVLTGVNMTVAEEAAAAEDE